MTVKNTVEFCDDTEALMVNLYAVMQRDVTRILQIMAELNNDNGDDDANLPSPDKK